MSPEIEKLIERAAYALRDGEPEEDVVSELEDCGAECSQAYLATKAAMVLVGEAPEGGCEVACE